MSLKKPCYVWDEKLIDECDRLPAVPGRASMIHDLIEAYDLLKHLTVVRSVLATDKDLKEFHSELYIDHLKMFTKVDEDYMSNAQDEEHGIGYDCPPVSNMFELVSTLAGGSITAARCLLLGISDVAINWCGGWHHANRFGAEGFCYVNDIVIAIENLKKKFSKVLYIDLDVHHEHEVDLEALSLLDDEQIRVLIPAIGPQAKFKRALLKWNASKLNSDVTECSKIYDNLENLVEVYGENIGGLTNSPRSSALSSPSTSSSCKSMSLDSLTTLLEKTPDGLQLLKERQQPLGEHNRKVLVREIATHTLRANPKAPVTAETYITWIKEISKFKLLTC